MNRKQNLIIDGQILQTIAWHRGMGKYILQLLHEIDLLLSDTMQVSIIFNDTLESDRKKLEAVKYLCPNIKQYNVHLPISKNKPHRSRAYKRRLEEFIDKEFHDYENLYLITSLFSFDFFAEFPEGCRKLLLIYDLTPLLFWKDLGGYFPPHLYMERFIQIYESDLVYSISETVRQDIIRIFGIEPEGIITIDGGFTKIGESNKPAGVRVPDRYVLFPTGDLPHKNNELAVQGFDIYNQQAGADLKLLLTSTLSEASKNKLSKISKDIIFTNNVTDAELLWLYVHSEAVLFASKYEGLGIPILDAVANDKPVITSKIPVFEEMSKNAYYFFDPSDEQSLATALRLGLEGDKFKSKQKHYPEVMEKYTWERTGSIFTKSFKRLDTIKTTDIIVDKANMPIIAVVCMNPGIENQIGRFAEVFHSALSQNFNVDYYFDSNGLEVKEMERPTFLDYINTRTLDISKLSRSKYRKYEAVIYLLDSMSIETRLGVYAAVLPGIVVQDKNYSDMTITDSLIHQVIISNQSGAHNINIDPNEDVRNSAESLRSYLIQYIQRRKNNSLPDMERIIRRRLPNRSIMSLLMRRAKND